MPKQPRYQGYSKLVNLNKFRFAECVPRLSPSPSFSDCILQTPTLTHLHSTLPLGH